MAGEDVEAENSFCGLGEGEKEEGEGEEDVFQHVVKMSIEAIMRMRSGRR